VFASDAPACQSGFLLKLFLSSSFAFSISTASWRAGLKSILKLLIVIQALKSATQRKPNQGTEVGYTIINLLIKELYSRKYEPNQVSASSADSG